MHDAIVHTGRAWLQEEMLVAEDESMLSRPARAADQVIAYGPDPIQIMETRCGGAAAGKRPLILIIHGGFWRPDIDRSHARPMADAIAAAGWTVALPEYSRVARDPDPTLADLALVLRQAPELTAGHNGRVLLVGHSAGAQLALWASSAGMCPVLSGTLALAPVADLRLAHELALGAGAVYRFLGEDPRRRPDLDPAQMPAPPTPTILVHGVDDEIVPVRVSESYIAGHSLARLIRVPDAGHYALIDPTSAAWPVVMAQLPR